jgi:colanic acid/amylovoran biosynthesis glycosyltransferase
MKERHQVCWHGWPHAPAPLPAFDKLGIVSIGNADRTLREVTIELVDDAGRPIRNGVWLQVREVARHVWLRTCTLLLRGLVTLVAPGRTPPLAATHPGPGPVVLVLPVLPDLSHTFVYREVLAILRQRPDWRVVVLGRNERAPVHAEARELLAHATFLRREGITAAAWRALRWLLRRRGRAWLATYGKSWRDVLGKQPLRDPRHPGNAFVLADQLAPLRPRHIHVYSSTWPANVALGAAQLLGVSASISSYVDFEFPYTHKLLAAKIAQATFCRVVTAYCRERLVALREAAVTPTTRIPVVLLGLDLPNWQQRAAPRGDGTLLSAARLVPKKGLHVVPAALAALRARGVRCRWRVAGYGPEQQTLAQLCDRLQVADLVDFVGPLANADVKQELLAADAALLPCVVTADGERDGIPIFLCEAMALGVPVVTTPVSGIPELVRDGDTGFLAVPGDSDSLADTLARVLSDPAATRAVAERGRDAVHAQLDVDTLAKQLIAEIER